MISDDLKEYINLDKAEKALADVQKEIDAKQQDLEELRRKKADLEQLVAMANGKKKASRTKTAGKSQRPNGSRSVDPQKVIDMIKKKGGKATLDELKDALGVGGRVIGGALRRDDRLTKDDEGYYTIAKKAS